MKMKTEINEIKKVLKIQNHQNSKCVLYFTKKKKNLIKIRHSNKTEQEILLTVGIKIYLYRSQKY